MVTSKELASRNQIPIPKFPEADCDTCPLRRKRFSKPELIGCEESSQARIMWVGESPGAQEIANQAVFTGQSGEILRAVIEEHGLTKYGNYLTNAIPCDVRTIEKGEVDWDKAMSHCRNRLMKEIEEVRPELIILMGNEAKKDIAPWQRKGIMNLSGEYDHSEELNIPILYAFHPAFILHAREGERYFSLWLDHLNEAKLFFEAEEFKPAVKVAKKTEDIYTFIKAMSGAKTITADVETTSFSPWDTGWSVTYTGKTFFYGTMLCISFCGDDSTTSYVIPDALFEDDDARNAMGEFLHSKQITCHNAIFDLPFIWKWITPQLFVHDDTMLKSYSMDETPWHGLKRLGRKYLGIEDWSQDTYQYRPKRDDSFANIPDDVLFPYAGLDTSVTSELNKRIEMDDNAKKLYREFLIPVTNMFTNMSYTGIKIDVKELMQASNELETLRQKHLVGLKKYGITNPNSWKQIYNALYNKLEVDIPEEAKTGKWYLESLMIDPKYKGTVDEWEWEVSEFAKDVQGYRSAHKGKNTYIKDVARSMSLVDNCVHPDFKLFATVTGRIVINNPTFTNYTSHTGYASQIRRPLIARPGWKWVHIDYKQFELRIYAGISRDPKMLKVLTTPMEDGSPRDPHTEIALEIYGPNYLEMNEKAFGFLRTITKTMVFGRLYGRGPGAMSFQLEVPMEEAERICNVIDSFWELENYHGMINERLDTTQDVINPVGRARRFPLITQENRHRCFNQACNYLIQSTASDLNLMAAYVIWKTFPNDVLPLFTIHDSIEFEIREDKFDEIFPKVLHLMRTVPQEILGIHDVPIEVDYIISDHWEAA